MTRTKLQRMTVAQLGQLAFAMHLSEREYARERGGWLPKAVLIHNILERRRLETEQDLASYSTFMDQVI